MSDGMTKEERRAFENERQGSFDARKNLRKLPSKAPRKQKRDNRKK